MTRGREQGKSDEWGVWEVGGPADLIALKKGIRRAEIGLTRALQTVETDVSYAAERVKSRIATVAKDLAAIDAFPLHEVILDNQVTKMPMIRSDMIGRFLDTQGTIRSYTVAAGEHAGLPVVLTDQSDEIEDMEILQTKGLWMKALASTLEDFKQGSQDGQSHA